MEMVLLAPLGGGFGWSPRVVSAKMALQTEVALILHVDEESVMTKESGGESAMMLAASRNSQHQLSTITKHKGATEV